ncbi:MAG: alpha/beta hydrolase [Treponema sp.]|nr:alpha/beta hydrolase [Treponema sp.]
MRTNDYENAFVYEMGNLSADTLVIDIEGSGWGSTLGRKQLGIWLYTGVAGALFEPLNQEHTLIVLEKWKRDPTARASINSGVYYDDLYLRSIYTLENLIDMYAESINRYMEDKHFTSIFLIGSSEGAIIMPLLYAKIEEREKVKGIVSIAGGGLPVYDSYSLLQASTITPRRYRKAYSYMIDSYDMRTEGRADSVEVDKYGTVLRWLTSLMEFDPFDYWKDVDIPVLFIHGEKDFNVAVESTRHIQENLPEKPFEFIYYKDMAHGPTTRSQISRMQNDIVDWIQKVKTQ